MNPTIKLIFLILGIIAFVVAAIIGYAKFTGGVEWMFLVAWLGAALGLASRLP